MVVSQLLHNGDLISDLLFDSGLRPRAAAVADELARVHIAGCCLSDFSHLTICSFPQMTDSFEMRACGVRLQLLTARTTRVAGRRSCEKFPPLISVGYFECAIEFSFLLLKEGRCAAEAVVDWIKRES